MLASEAIALPTGKAVSFGIVVTELLTNACKYANPQDVGGEVPVLVEMRRPTERLVVEDGRGGVTGGRAIEHGPWLAHHRVSEMD